jgi:hypothetical protein
MKELPMLMHTTVSQLRTLKLDGLAVSRRPGQDPIAYGISDVDWNCFDRSMRVKDVAMFTAKGELINKGNVSKVTYIQPETWAENLLALQCPKAN